jgi:serine/threonine protein phosphatase PrpC
MALIGKIEFTSHAASHVGKVRKVNEDACLDRCDIGMWVVADGMGGHNAGDLASQSIIAELRHVLAPDKLSTMIDDIEDRLLEVNAHLRQISAQQHNYNTIGSTVVVLVIYGYHSICLWAGDSRVYRLRSGVLKQMTRDHSQVEELIQQGLLRHDQAENHPQANVITRAVGADDQLLLDIDIEDAFPDDTYLLCSDGLYKHLSPDDIAIILGRMEPKSAANRLIDLANERGGTDNITAVVVRTRAAPK